MQLAQVQHTGGEICSHLLIESVDDLIEYKALRAANTVDTVRRVLCNQIDPSSWDHYGHDGEFGNSFNMAVRHAQIHGGRPLLEIDNRINDVTSAMLRTLLRGHKLIVNHNGGWCMVLSELHTIMSVQQYDTKVSRQQYITINDNTKWINLENDHKLEQHTIDYLSQLDPNYSHIVNLSKFTQQELTKVFTTFVESGGIGVYVYTTGSDVVQMWQYCKALRAAGIKQVQFEFNSGISDDHHEICKWLTDNSITVQLISS